MHLKTRKGGCCQSPAMPNGRCRMHGGKSTGAPKGNRNAHKHGFYSKENKEILANIKMLVSESKQLSRNIL